jgi:TonB family protein
VISGPEEVRNAVLRSVLNWHFDRDAAGSVRQISVTFQPPAPSEPPVPGATMEQRLKQLEAEQKARPPANGPRGILKGIVITGLSDSAKTDLLARLPVHEGDTLSPDQLPRILESVKAFDEHLTVNLSPQLSGETVLRITGPGARSASFAAVSPIRDASGAVQAIRVGGNVQAAKLISQPKPIYPPAAKEARIQGVVQLLATIAKDGTVKDLQVILGEPLLVEAAMSAVQQWVYQPTLLNGNPVEVVTQIDVNFTLRQ